MDYVNLGKSGLKVSRLGLGMMTYGDPNWREWVLDEAAARPFVQRALELGINFFDTANMYSAGISEVVTGRLLKALARRDEVVLATKVYFPTNEKDPNGRGLSRKHIMDAIDNSLKRLDVEYVDLYQIHRWDPTTPIEETMEALHDVVRAGKARYIGASSMFAWQFAKAQHTAVVHHWTRFISMQNHYNLVYREEEREMNPLCLDQGVGLVPWSPLARGFLAGNRKPDDYNVTVRAKTDQFAHSMYYQPEDFEIVDRLVEVATELEAKPAQVALAWLLHKPGVSAPIIGASKMYQLEEAVAATQLTLSAEQIKRLEEPYRPHPIMGHG